jgi:hypothetical protein
MNSPEYRSMTWAEFDSVVYALQDMAPNTRREAVIASCDEKDLRAIAELAAYMLGPEIVEIIQKVLRERDGARADHPVEAKVDK